MQQFSEVDEYRTNFASIILSSKFTSVKMEPTVENLDIKSRVDETPFVFIVKLI